MAIIGVRYAYLIVSNGDEATGLSLGRISSLSCNMQRTQLSQLQQYKTICRGANVSIQSDGSFSSDAFNVSGSLRWCCTEMQNGETSIIGYQLDNVVLQEPDVSVAGKQDTISFSTYTITGQSWNPSLTKQTFTSYADAESWCKGE